MIQRVLTYNGKVLKSSNKPATTNIAAIDADGNYYNSVRIGNQEWLIQNLRTTKYRDGTLISNLINDTSWGADTYGAYCEYDNSTGLYVNPYGYLYNSHALNNSHGLAPTGWKIPSKADVNILITYFGDNYSTIGGKLKETGITHWNTPNTGASDEYGFKSIPGGFRDFVGTFDFCHTYNYFWSSTSEGTGGYFFWMRYDNAYFNYDNGWTKNMGYSIRCMRYINFPEVSIGTQIWSKFNYDVGGSTYPDNSPINVADYGMLYTWDEAMTINVPGWHLPSWTEFNTLQIYLGGSAVAGIYLKEVSTNHWNYTDTSVNNSSGFTALGAGINGNNFKTTAFFWTTMENGLSEAFTFYLEYDSSISTPFIRAKTETCSVRLIKNT